MKKSNLLKLVYIAIIVFSLLPTTKLRAVDDPIPLGAQQTNSPKTTYTLLAPIGNLKEINTTDIGKYLNTMFLIIIGLCGALAVIMIVIGGVQYMGTESVFGKTEAKGKILSAILGLLIALGSYAILRTIDPALTGEGGVSVEQVASQISEEDNNYTPQEASKIIQSYGDIGKVTGDGVIADSRVINKVAPIIERPQNTNRSSIKAIIFHGTAGGTSESAFATWITKGGSSGAHFIIAKDGTIWQTARTTKYTNHFKPDIVGVMPSGTSNSNTIGIEIVQKCIKDCGTNRSLKKAVWEAPTSGQVQSAAYLTFTLMKKYDLPPTSLYPHGEVATNRTYNEGRDIINKILGK